MTAAAIARPRRNDALARLGFALALGASGCGDSLVGFDAGARDLSVPADLTGGDGGETIFARVTMAGCAELVVTNGTPRCKGPAPLVLTLVPVTAGPVEEWLWTTPGGTPASSKMLSPTVRYGTPGSYAVTLVVSGPGGGANADAEVLVLPAPTGGACEGDEQCGLGYVCECRPGDGGGASCPGALAGGFCTRGCDGTSCQPGEQCVDLSRSLGGAGPGGWQRPLCLPGCATSAECRPGFVCRSVPALAPGATAGGPFLWRRACFAAVLDDVGAACFDSSGKPAPTRCITGECASLGARGLCTMECGEAGCPPGTVCATFSRDTSHPMCVARCGSTQPCTDPLLACQTANPMGEYGFVVGTGDPPGTTYCTPRRCGSGGECAPAGTCVIPDGGVIADGGVADLAAPAPDAAAPGDAGALPDGGAPAGDGGMGTGPDGPPPPGFCHKL